MRPVWRYGGDSGGGRVTPAPWVLRGAGMRVEVAGACRATASSQRDLQGQEGTGEREGGVGKDIVSAELS